MTFTRPDLLGLAPVAAFLVAVALTSYSRRARRLVDAYGGPAPARRLTGRDLEAFPLARLVCLLVAVVSLCVAAADPQPEEAEPVAAATPIDLIVAIDVSHSMTASDVESTRIGRAKSVLGQIVEARVADRIALTLFADWPLGLVPLTDDAEVVTFFTPWVASELVGGRDQGTSLAAAVGQAVVAWEARPRPGTLPMLLVITDGEAHGERAEILDSIAVASEAGLVVWTAGVGTTQGAALFAPGTDDVPLLDADGQAVVSTYDADLLRDMAEEGGGAFHEVGSDAGVRRLVDDLRDLGGVSASEASPERSPIGILLVLALALLTADAVLDSGQLARRRSA